ncbi:MAG: MBL fold metallo-hydrolase [archaeon YNP-WB-062]|jgi:glyoxylase-like metal-dependent hydrolase (beta-lactamase superfamily II)|nr:MBL fold metallo-hydrolase [Candidatus Culexarchaeum yellowstonense]
MEITKHIELVDGSFCNVYIVKVIEGYLLIDAGDANNAMKVLGYINGRGMRNEDCKGIIVTHHHRDHIGCLAELKETLKTKVIAHKLETPYIDGRVKSQRTAGVKYVNVDVEVDDGDIVYGMKVIHTPGHTPGSICLHHQEDKALFVGDLMVNENNVLKEIPTHYSMNPDQNRESIEKIYRELNFEIALPSHGQPITSKARERIGELIKTFKQTTSY